MGRLSPIPGLSDLDKDDPESELLSSSGGLGILCVGVDGVLSSLALGILRGGEDKGVSSRALPPLILWRILLHSSSKLSESGGFIKFVGFVSPRLVANRNEMRRCRDCTKSAMYSESDPVSPTSSSSVLFRMRIPASLAGITPFPDIK
jgi:hypothetical protein